MFQPGSVLGAVNKFTPCEPHHISNLKINASDTTITALARLKATPFALLAPHREHEGANLQPT
jgi:hypothetical protein